MLNDKGFDKFHELYNEDEMTSEKRKKTSENELQKYLKGISLATAYEEI